MGKERDSENLRRDVSRGGKGTSWRKVRML